MVLLKLFRYYGVFSDPTITKNNYSPMKIIKLWLILFCIGPIAHAQSAFKISPMQAVTQSTNMPFEMTDNYAAMIKTHQQYPIFSIPYERGSNIDDFMITGRITNSVFCAASATNAFQAVMKATETSKTTNLNLKAAYSRVANESARLFMTNNVEELHNLQTESK
jgi:hypothetical protein